METRRSAREQLRAATDRFLAELAAVSEDQWRFRPGAKAWSVSEVAEHVALSNSTLLRLLSKPLLGSPLAGRRPDVLDLEIPYLFYRGDEPPDVGRPSGEWHDPRVATESVGTTAGAILDWADRVESDLRTLGLPHPAFGLLDGVQWVLFVAAHTERHRAQILGLRRHPEFPA